MDDKSKEFHKFFSETYLLFKKVTAYAVFLEKLDENQVDVAAINELRGVLFHLYGYLDENSDNPESFSANYIEAKEHLHRAYFDLFSTICTILIEKIYNFSEIFSIDVISAIYPSYFTEIIPGVYSLIEEISHVRTNRKIHDESLQTIEVNHEIVMKLINWQKSLTSLTNSFQEKKSLYDQNTAKAKHDEIKARKKERRDLLWRFVIPLLMLILGFLLNHLIDFSKPPDKRPTSKQFQSGKK